MTNPLPLVSIAIPTYNRANGYLKQAIQSALSQTYPEIEILISNNCSTDNTEEVARAFDDKRIRYYRQKKNIGANNNFNFLLRKARGAYFMLLQDDDVIDNDFIETCLKGVSYGTRVGVIQCGTRVIDAEGRVISELPNRVEGSSAIDFFRGWFACKTSPYLCSTLFNTTMLREIGGFGSRHNLFQDVLAETQLAARFGRVGIPEVKASFRKHPGEMTFAARVGDWCDDSLQLLDVMCGLVPGKKKLIRREGRPFLAKLNYNRARAVKSLWGRIAAYFIVFRKFGCRYLPAKDHILTPLYGCLQRTPVYNGMRFIKRKIRAGSSGI